MCAIWSVVYNVRGVRCVVCDVREQKNVCVNEVKAYNLKFNKNKGDDPVFKLIEGVDCVF